MSQPSWAAWIEITTSSEFECINRSQPSWAAWIEMSSFSAITALENWSQPSWAAWIEITIHDIVEQARGVAALLGCVD